MYLRYAHPFRPALTWSASLAAAGFVSWAKLMLATTLLLTGRPRA